jgi:hypothetical protein
VNIRSREFPGLGELTAINGLDLVPLLDENQEMRQVLKLALTTLDKRHPVYRESERILGEGD